MDNKFIGIRKPENNDLTRIKEIWKLCFMDECSYIDFYFNNRDWQGQMAVLTVDGIIASMLTMIPVKIIKEDGEVVNCTMLYAIATHPQYQKHRLADKLMSWSSDYLLSNQVPLTMLVPAEPSLYKFYEDRGYKTECYIRETAMSRELIESIKGSNKSECKLYPIEPGRYSQIRRRHLQGFTHVDYREAEILFQKKTSLLFNGDIYSIQTDEGEGCAIVERTEEIVIVKEILIQEKYFASAIKEISAMMPAQRYIFRTPSFFQCELGGAIRPFGMVRVSSKLPNPSPQNIYIGIAYD